MAAAKSNTNWFVIGVSAAVVVVLAVLAFVVVFLNNQATAPGTAASICATSVDPQRDR